MPSQHIQYRPIHLSRRVESSLVVGGLALFATGVAWEVIRQGLAKPTPPPSSSASEQSTETASKVGNEKEEQKVEEGAGGGNVHKSQEASSGSTADSTNPASDAKSSWNTWFDDLNKNVAPGESSNSSNSNSTSSSSGSNSSSRNNAAKEKEKEKTKSSSGESSSFGFGSSWFARNFYDGGFEEKMTRREAALILGIRESATPERIKEAHRRVLMLNHPDKGGSDYVATKINEAKELLMKGK